MTTCRTVIVKDLPESVTMDHIPELCRELVPLAHGDWPCLVLDFSAVMELDRAGVELLLRTMEEVVKRNGDVKFAAVSPQIGLILELTRVDRLFEFFDKAADAVSSFTSFPLAAFRRNPDENQTHGVVQPRG
jgi:anti-anti-sigma regulatory factor